MNFSLTPTLEQFVRDQARSGNYNNASEVVREAIRLFMRTEKINAIKMENLKAAIQVGDEAINRGESIAFESDEDMDSFFAKL
ncbi:MAG: type II toxin-antitoxin system ParD family antitoxin [Gammaproteobacteria bacterium]|nr:type II toxin-antitoxin system ParD family antitoxin [Gammaproteobacteria bacterium]